MSNLPYTDKEICKSFMQNPTDEQIKRLSELNDCKKSEIIHLLSSYGIKNRKVKNTKTIKKIYINKSITDYIHKRRKKLEFICLSEPSKQKEYLDEMQMLMNLMNIESKEECYETN